jgi:hypothetical protein
LKNNNLGGPTMENRDFPVLERRQTGTGAA